MKTLTLKTLSISTLVLIAATGSAQAQLGGVTDTAGSVRSSADLALEQRLGAEAGLDDLRAGQSLSRIERMRLDRARREARRAERAARNAAPEAGASGTASLSAAAEALDGDVSAGGEAMARAATETPALPTAPTPRPVAQARTVTAPARAAVETTTLPVADVPAPSVDSRVAVPVPAPQADVAVPAPSVRVATPAPVVRERRTVYVASPPEPVRYRSERVETRIVADSGASGGGMTAAPAPAPASPERTSLGSVRALSERGLPLCLAALLILGLVLGAREITRPRGRTR